MKVQELLKQAAEIESRLFNMNAARDRLTRAYGPNASLGDFITVGLYCGGGGGEVRASLCPASMLSVLDSAIKTNEALLAPIAKKLAAIEAMLQS